MRALIIFMMICLPITAHACSCLGPNDTSSLFNDADAVILAEVQKTHVVKTAYDDHDVEYIVATIDILETFKESTTKVQKVIDLVPNIGNCSIGLMSGVEYLFFVHNTNDDHGKETLNERTTETQNYVGQCTGSHPVNMYHKNFKKKSNELRQLGK